MPYYKNKNISMIYLFSKKVSTQINYFSYKRNLFSIKKYRLKIGLIQQITIC